MVRGQPDYGITTQTPVASGISDPGEAAARLGSINIYDRRGWTVWMDDFEAPDLKWSATSSVGGTKPVLSTTEAWMGVQSAYFYTAAVAGRLSGMDRRWPLLRLGRIGIEFWILLDTKAPGEMRIKHDIHDGTNRSTAEVRLDLAGRDATIIAPDGEHIIFELCFNDLLTNVFMPVKLVVDMDTDYYTRLLVGPREVNISQYPLVAGGATAFRYHGVDFQLVGDAGNAMSAYVDNFILTQNEP